MAGYKQMPLESVWTNESDNNFSIKGKKKIKHVWRQRTTRSPSLRRHFRSDTIRYGCIHAHEIELNRLMRAQKIQQFLKSKWDLSEIRTQIEIYFLRFFQLDRLVTCFCSCQKRLAEGKREQKTKNIVLFFQFTNCKLRCPENLKCIKLGGQGFPVGPWRP